MSGKGKSGFLYTNQTQINLSIIHSGLDSNYILFFPQASKYIQYKTLKLWIRNMQPFFKYIKRIHILVFWPHSEPRWILADICPQNPCLQLCGKKWLPCLLVRFTVAHLSSKQPFYFVQINHCLKLIPKVLKLFLCHSQQQVDSSIFYTASI